MENTQKSPWAWWVLGAIIIVALVWWAKTGGIAMAPKAPVETGPIKVGAVGPLTGDASSYGLAMQRTISLAVEDINADGGINGRPLEVVWEDGKCSGTDAASATQKLVNADGVKFLLGFACSGEMLAAAPITQEARTLMISGLASSPDLTKAGDLVFRTYPSDAFAGSLMAKYTAKVLQADRVAVLSENTDYAQALRRTFTGEFSGEVAVDETYNPGTTDFRSVATKVAAANVNAVYIIPQTPTSMLLLLKQLKDAGVKAQLLSTDSTLDRSIVAKNKDLFEGLIAPELSADDSKPKTKAFLDGYLAKYGFAPEYPSYLAAAYDSVSLLAEAMEKGNMTPDDVAHYFNTEIHGITTVQHNFIYRTDAN